MATWARKHAWAERRSKSLCDMSKTVSPEDWTNYACTQLRHVAVRARTRSCTCATACHHIGYLCIYLHKVTPWGFGGWKVDGIRPRLWCAKWRLGRYGIATVDGSSFHRTSCSGAQNSLCMAPVLSNEQRALHPSARAQQVAAALEADEALRGLVAHVCARPLASSRP